MPAFKEESMEHILMVLWEFVRVCICFLTLFIIIIILPVTLRTLLTYYPQIFLLGKVFFFFFNRTIFEIHFKMKSKLKLSQNI